MMCLLSLLACCCDTWQIERHMSLPSVRTFSNEINCTPRTKGRAVNDPSCFNIHCEIESLQTVSVSDRGSAPSCLSLVHFCRNQHCSQYKTRVPVALLIIRTRRITTSWQHGFIYSLQASAWTSHMCVLLTVLPTVWPMHHGIHDATHRVVVVKKTGIHEDQNYCHAEEYHVMWLFASARCRTRRRVGQSVLHA